MDAVAVSLPGGETLELATDPLAGERTALAGTGAAPARTRLAIAAAHVALRDGYERATHTPARPGSPEELLEAIDWEATLGLRRRLDALGFGVAEAMDTAQRFELGWPASRRLIEETGALGLAGGFVAGASYDHAPAPRDREELADAVLWQAELVRAAGGLPVLLPMPWLAEHARGEDDYVATYERIVRGAGGPLLVHWLGPAFHPAMTDYFPGGSFEAVMALDRERIRGAKLSLLDPAREVALRRALLPHGQVVLTGDDLAFDALVRGGDPGPGPAPVPPVTGWTRVGPWEVALGDFSHALLGVLDAVAEPMAVALAWLDRGEGARWQALAGPCAALGAVVFAHPTDRYKVGLALLAWLSGLQPNRMLANHLERERDREHLVAVIRAAAGARVLAGSAAAAEGIAALLR